MSYAEHIRAGSFDINLDAREILDRVDEMLAWEAIASTANPAYTWTDMLRAEPVIRLGRFARGRLRPGMVEVEDAEAAARMSVEARKSDNCEFNAMCRTMFTQHFDAMMSRLGERLSYAWLEECDPGEELIAKLGNYIGKSSDDQVGDMNVGEDAWVGARFHLHSVAEMNRPSAEQYRRIFKLPQSSRLFAHEHVVAFNDGRTTSGVTTFGAWGGGLFNMDKMPTRIEVEDGRYFDWAAHELSDAWAAQDRRREEWTVELALAANRTGIGLATDADGARGFLNMLAKDETRRGRSTLVHWVSEHMRKSRKADADPHLVRAHLRGKQIIRAGGYFARIYPSRVDIERACNGKRFDIAQKAG